MAFKVHWVPFRTAGAFIAEHHRHHRPPQGGIVCLGLFCSDVLVGVAVIGRPVARMADDGSTAEITRLCVLPGCKNAASKLLAKAKHAAQALGFARVITYTLPEEGGASLRGAGFSLIATSGGGEWSRPSRARDNATFPIGRKDRWQAELDLSPAFTLAGE